MVGNQFYYNILLRGKSNRRRFWWIRRFSSSLNYIVMMAVLQKLFPFPGFFCNFLSIFNKSPFELNKCWKIWIKNKMFEKHFWKTFLRHNLFSKTPIRSLMWLRNNRWFVNFRSTFVSSQSKNSTCWKNSECSAKMIFS